MHGPFGLQALEIKLDGRTHRDKERYADLYDYDRGEPKMAIFFVSAGGGILHTVLLWGGYTRSDIDTEGY